MVPNVETNYNKLREFWDAQDRMLLCDRNAFQDTFLGALSARVSVEDWSGALITATEAMRKRAMIRERDTDKKMGNV